ncbi:hypothetical protein ABVT39_024395 [Epinephelus coioides]
MEEEMEQKMAKPLKTSFEGWRYAHYFDFIARKEKNVTVKCKLCPGQKQLSTAANTTSNLSKHLQRQHANIKLVAKDPRTLSDAEDKLTPAKQPRFVPAYIVEEMLLVSTVESPSFRNILSEIQVRRSGRPPSDRKTFASYLDQCHVEIETELKKTSESLEYVSTIADIWTSHNKSRLGIKAFTERLYQFLKEYCTVMQPLTVALDLQGEDNCYYGSLLPVLEILMSETLALQNRLSRMTAGLPNAILQTIKTRFGSVLDSKDALLAAVTLPKF